MFYKLQNFLDGKKTYIGWGAIIVYGALIHFQVVQSNEMVWGLIASWTGISYRAAQAKVIKAIQSTPVTSVEPTVPTTPTV